MTPSPFIVRSALPAVLLAALCASAEQNGYLERVEAAPELRAELDRYGLEAGVYVQPQAGCDSAAAGRALRPRQRPSIPVVHILSPLHVSDVRVDVRQGQRHPEILAICGKDADNKYRYAGGCKGRVFLASEKFNPVRECGPGFRKNL